MKSRPDAYDYHRRRWNNVPRTNRIGAKRYARMSAETIKSVRRERDRLPALERLGLPRGQRWRHWSYTEKAWISGTRHTLKARRLRKHEP